MWTLGSQLILASSGFILNIIIGNHYGPDGLGVFNQSLAIFMMLALISDVGLSNSTLKFIAEYNEYDDKKNFILGSSIFLSFLLAFVVSFVVIILSKSYESLFYSKETTTVLFYNMLGLPFFIVNRILLAYLNGNRKMKLYSLGRSLRWLNLIILFFIFIKLDFPLYYSILAFPFSEIILLCILLLIVLKEGIKLKINKEWLRIHFSFGIKTVFVALLSEGNNRTDIFITSLFLTQTQIGIYSLASSVAKGLYLIPGIVAINFNPIISNLWSKNLVKELEIKIHQVKKVLFKISTPLILFGGLLYPLIIWLFMKDPIYWDSLPIFYVILFGVLMFSNYYHIGGFLTMCGFPEMQLVNVIAVLVFNLISTWILASLFSLYGAASATTLMYIFVLFSQSYFIKRKTGINILIRKNTI